MKISADVMYLPDLTIYEKLYFFGKLLVMLNNTQLPAFEV